MSDKELKEACKYIVETTGNCPFDTFGFDPNCAEICHEGIDIWQCWYKYFKEREEKEVE